MVQQTITKNFTWDMAHMLEDHCGLCKNLHGHSYNMQVTVQKIKNNKNQNKSSLDMVMDFKDLKNVVNTVVVEKFDHSFVFNINDKESKEIADLLLKMNKKIFPLTFRTTAENLVVWIFKELNVALKPFNVKCTEIELWETSTSSAIIKEK